LREDKSQYLTILSVSPVKLLDNQIFKNVALTMAITALPNITLTGESSIMNTESCITVNYISLIIYCPWPS